MGIKAQEAADIREKVLLSSVKALKIFPASLFLLVKRELFQKLQKVCSLALQLNGLTLKVL